MSGVRALQSGQQELVVDRSPVLERLVKGDKVSDAEIATIYTSQAGSPYVKAFEVGAKVRQAEMFFRTKDGKFFGGMQKRGTTHNVLVFRDFDKPPVVTDDDVQPCYPTGYIGYQSATARILTDGHPVDLLRVLERRVYALLERLALGIKGHRRS